MGAHNGLDAAASGSLQHGPDRFDGPDLLADCLEGQLRDLGQSFAGILEPQPGQPLFDTAPPYRMDLGRLDALRGENWDCAGCWSGLCLSALCFECLHTRMAFLALHGPLNAFRMGDRLFGCFDCDLLGPAVSNARVDDGVYVCPIQRRLLSCHGASCVGAKNLLVFTDDLYLRRDAFDLARRPFPLGRCSHQFGAQRAVFGAQYDAFLLDV